VSGVVTERSSESLSSLEAFFSDAESSSRVSRSSCCWPLLDFSFPLSPSLESPAWESFRSSALNRVVGSSAVTCRPSASLSNRTGSAIWPACFALARNRQLSSCPGAICWTGSKVTHAHFSHSVTETFFEGIAGSAGTLATFGLVVFFAI
jgi:hypothetical protein